MSTRQLSEPKGFQRATASAALAALTDRNGSQRFLVADEAGLGKTVVARTILVEMMRKRRTPLVVFYFASNLNISHQNRSKLLEMLPFDEDQKRAAAKVDRLTLASDASYRPTHDRLHLYCLTPDTSIPTFRRRAGLGRMDERALIHRLLVGRFPSLASKAFSDLFKGRQPGEASWTAARRQYDEIEGIRDLQGRFFDALGKDRQLALQCVDAECLSAAIASLRPAVLMGSLRTALAMATVDVVRPDLVIFDEFQKFRDLLIDPPGYKADDLVRALRGDVSRRPAILLLSATPYRHYSTRKEEASGQSHHEDFVKIVRFLFGSDTRTPNRVEESLRKFGTLMMSPDPSFEELGDLQKQLQNLLRPVLSRSERPDRTSAAQSRPRSIIGSEDVRVFKHWVNRLRAADKRLGTVDPVTFAVPYWLSVPLPVQMLGKHYAAWRRAKTGKPQRGEPALRRSQRDRLDAPKVWPHPQLRVLNETVSAARLSLPWIAPSLPWWDLEGPWAAPGAGGGKVLLFSRFKAVPQALASLLSYNLEASLGGALKRSYERVGLAQPLQLKSDRPTLLGLFFPSPTIIAYTDPRHGNPKTITEVRKSMRHQVAAMLRDELEVKIVRKGRHRPLWRIVAAMEQRRSTILAGKWPDSLAIRTSWLRAAAGQDEVMREVLDNWNAAAKMPFDTITLREVAELAEHALSGPGIVLGRALYRYDRSCLDHERFGGLLEACWIGLRGYLNRALFQATLTRRGQTYTDAIPAAVVSGGLESVLDEHLWITSQIDADAIQRFPQDFVKSVGIRNGRHRVHEAGSQDGFLLRCHTAMPFADARVDNPKTGGEDRLRTDDLRRSFNSPFWPHVLATTSLGQEGLDFHVWCKQLVHWDLCSSPLDLEQREGRIQRYGGLSVRRALAVTHRLDALEYGKSLESPWVKLASHAQVAYAADASGRSPWWTCAGHAIDRTFVVLPHSRQTMRFDQLSRQRWLYRLALGQPHQQDFIETVARLPDDGRQQFALKLSAWREEEPTNPV